MKISWPNVVNALMGLAGLALLGWAFWLSDSVVEIKTQVAAVDSKVSGVDERVTRISTRLPTEIALHTRELYNREIRTAVISSKAQFVGGVWTRHIAVYDQENNLIKTYPFPINSPSDNGWLQAILWKVSASDTSSIAFSTFEAFRKLYHLEVPRMPDFVDVDHSVITSKRAEDVMANVEAQYQQRASMRSEQVEPEIQRLSQQTKNFEELTKELILYEAAFRP